MTDDSPTSVDLEHVNRAVRFALEAEAAGNLPIGAVITLGGEVVAGAGNAVLAPVYHPGRHAEIEALRLVPPALWPRAREMTCYTTLEPCVMCMGALLLHGVGRVVFGSTDAEGGAGPVLAHLPRYYAGGRGAPRWVGPVAPEACDPLFDRARARFDSLPCGRDHF
ncbi:MAG TPA: nucleoside deaminase [Pyrinomonadaceae bacterium]|nr:nucleoside deaminase [Pyrinomonadaceae bacterium]